MRFEVSSELRALLTLHVVDLRELSVPEESVRLAAIDALDVHPQGHYDLVVGVRGGLIFQPNLDCLVRYLHHLEVVLHLLLQNSVIQDRDAGLIHGRENLLVATTPFKLGDRLGNLGLHWGSRIPTLTCGGALSRHLLAFPHHDVTVLGST